MYSVPNIPGTNSEDSSERTKLPKPHPAAYRTKATTTSPTFGAKARTAKLAASRMMLAWARLRSFLRGEMWSLVTMKTSIAGRRIRKKMRLTKAVSDVR
jgi:hypothetical protein